MGKLYPQEFYQRAWLSKMGKGRLLNCYFARLDELIDSVYFVVVEVHYLTATDRKSNYIALHTVKRRKYDR